MFSCCLFPAKEEQTPTDRRPLALVSFLMCLSFIVMVFADWPLVARALSTDKEKKTQAPTFFIEWARGLWVLPVDLSALPRSFPLATCSVLLEPDVRDWPRSVGGKGAERPSSARVAHSSRPERKKKRRTRVL